MNQIYNTVFQVLEGALFKKEVTFPENVDWERTVAEMIQQTVEGLGFEVGKNVGIPSEIEERWNMIVLRKVGSWLRLMEAQQDAVNRFRENDISFAIIKGTAASMYYPKPEYRSMGDIDLVVHPNHFKKACTVLLEAGYDLYKDGEQEEQHHAEFIKQDIMVEVHYKFNSGKGNTEGAYLSELLYEGLNHVQWVNIEKYTFPVLPKLQSGLVILQHIANHLKGGLGLRQMIDWMMFVYREMDDSFWKESFRPMVQTLHLEQLAITATGMCRKYLGLPEASWCPPWDESLVDQLMNYVMIRGNFGRKTTESEQGVRVFSNRSLWGFLKSLQGKGEYHWKAYKKHPWLRPFAWFYQICRYIKLGLGRKNPIQAIKKDYEISNQRKQFFEELDINPSMLSED